MANRGDTDYDYLSFELQRLLQRREVTKQMLKNLTSQFDVSDYKSSCPSNFKSHQEVITGFDRIFSVLINSNVKLFYQGEDYDAFDFRKKFKDDKNPYLLYEAYLNCLIGSIDVHVKDKLYSAHEDLESKIRSLHYGLEFDFVQGM
jgi:hypothetical protein